MDWTCSAMRRSPLMNASTTLPMSLPPPMFRRSVSPSPGPTPLGEVGGAVSIPKSEENAGVAVLPPGTFPGATVPSMGNTTPDPLPVDEKNPVNSIPTKSKYTAVTDDGIGPELVSSSESRLDPGFVASIVIWGAKAGHCPELLLRQVKVTIAAVAGTPASNAMTRQPN